MWPSVVLHSYSLATILCQQVAFLSSIFPGSAYYLGSDNELHDTIIAIDLGSMYSRVGLLQDGQVSIFTNHQGSCHTPSYVAFTNEGILVGEAAKNQSVFYPTITLLDIKPLMIHNSNDAEVQAIIQNHQLVVNSWIGQPVVDVDVNRIKKRFSPARIYAAMLEELKRIAELHVKKAVKYAIVTVPAYLEDSQREAIMDAGALAGLEILRVFHEHVAASLAYGLDELSVGQDERLVVICDFGARSFDISLYEIDSGVHEQLQTSHNPHLGGVSFDQMVMEHFVELCHDRWGIDIREHARIWNKLMDEVVNAKHALSFEESSLIRVEDSSTGVNISEVLTRSRFEAMNAELFEKISNSIKQVLKDANISQNSIDDVILAGGSNNMPKVQCLFDKYFGSEKVKKAVNLDEVNVWGAIIHTDVFLSEVLDYKYWERCTAMVTDSVISIETSNGNFTKLIGKTKFLPAYATHVLTTSSDNQSTLPIKIYKDDNDTTMGNLLLGEFELGDINPASRGVSRIEVSAYLSKNQFLTVQATDMETGNVKGVVLWTGTFQNDEVNSLHNSSYDPSVNIEEEYDHERSLCCLNKVRHTIQIRNDSYECDSDS
ncbi:putative Hsp70 chaperone BiP/Kar2 [Xylogone sp. PMI_703]|nr:putative Hsp70 chaperone BiP/Kar2 [Xylogone sp. PMI_703]